MFVMVYLHTVDITHIYLNFNRLYIFLYIIRLQRLSCLDQLVKCDGRQMRTLFCPSYHCRCADCICSSVATMVHKALCWWYNAQHFVFVIMLYFMCHMKIAEDNCLQWTSKPWSTICYMAAFEAIRVLLQSSDPRSVINIQFVNPKIPKIAISNS